MQYFAICRTHLSFPFQTRLKVVRRLIFQRIFLTRSTPFSFLTRRFEITRRRCLTEVPPNIKQNNSRLLDSIRFASMTRGPGNPSRLDVTAASRKGEKNPFLPIRFDVIQKALPNFESTNRTQVANTFHWLPEYPHVSRNFTFLLRERGRAAATRYKQMVIV